MCLMISVSAPVTGSGRGPTGWFRLTQVNVGFDHATHAPLDHALLLDFVNPELGIGARIAVELDLASGRTLVAQLQAAISAAEASEPAIASRE